MKSICWRLYSITSDEYNYLTTFDKHKIELRVDNGELHNVIHNGIKVGAYVTKKPLIYIISHCEEIDMMLMLKFGNRLIKIQEYNNVSMVLW